MQILIKFPTRGRPDNFFRALDLYLNNAEDPGRLRVQVTIDDDDLAMTAPEVLERLAGYPRVVLTRGMSTCKIHAINRDLLMDVWDILLLASDDMIPVEKGYDNIIRSRMQEHYPDTDGVLWFNDGNRADLNTLSILGRRFYERFDYIYHPGYRSLYCDKEFTLVADRLGRQTYFDQVIIRHEHPSYGYRDMDAVYQDNDRNKDPDFRLFLRRQARRFDIGHPITNGLLGLAYDARRLLNAALRPWR
ncbi:MAG: hypothetical protein EBZ67_11335 [Chitinophagia bacterium]|nr:hypothetical protein [Chitinophagia bacterium]